MKKSSSNDYVTYMSYFWPLSTNNSCFAEYSLDKAISQNITPWEFESQYESYRQEIYKTIETTLQSSMYGGHLIFISGHAGDGKTHFIRNLLSTTKNDSFIFNEHVFTQAIGFEALHQIKNTNYEDKSINTNLFIVDQFIKQTSFIKTLKYENFDLKIITDLTTFTESYTNELLAVLNHILVSSSSHKIILIIAGNDGKILEVLSSLITVCAHKQEELKSSDCNSENNSLFSYPTTTIATPALDYTSLHNALTVKLIQLQELFIEHNPLKTDETNLSVFDMAKCIDKSLLSNIFTTMFDKERLKSFCGSCSCIEQNAEDGLPLCPILHNFELLNKKQIQNQIIDIFRLLQDLGNHFTVRQILMIMSNMCLGRINTSAPIRDNAQIWTCHAIRRNRNNGFNYLDLFDCLFGYNLKKQALSTTIGAEKRDVALVYNALRSVAVGENSSPVINQFLQNSDNPTIAQFLQKTIGANELKELQATYASFKDYTQTNNHIELKHSIEKLTKIRRHLFFMMNLNGSTSSNTVSQNNNCEDDIPFNAYSLTAYSYANEYFNLSNTFTLKNNAEQIKNFCKKYTLNEFLRKSELNNLPKIFLGLNKVFTGLPLNTDIKKVFIPFDSFNSIEYHCCVLSEHYELDYMTYQPNSINLSIQDKLNKKLVLQYLPHDYADNNNSAILLKLTPIHIEYLMSVADGKSSLSFEPEIQHEFYSFKKAIFRRIQNYILKEPITNGLCLSTEDDSFSLEEVSSPRVPGSTEAQTYSNLSQSISFKYLKDDGTLVSKTLEKEN